MTIDDEIFKKKNQTPTAFALFQDNYQNPFKTKRVVGDGFKNSTKQDLDNFLETEMLVNSQFS